MGKINDLGLDVVVGPGRRAKPLVPVVVREVRESDLAMLAENRGTQAIALKKITDRHHALARLIAAGTPPGEAALMLGMNNAYVSTLQSDPAFKDLVGLYREKVDVAFEDTLGHIAGLSKDTVVEMRDRLEEDPESFSNGQLLEVFKAMADRSGNGPMSTQVNVSTNLAERINAARERAKEARLKTARDITPPEDADE